MAKTRFTNTSTGARGVRNVDGELVMIERGKSASVEVNEGELKDARASGDFKIGGETAAPAEEPNLGDEDTTFDPEAFIGRTLEDITDDDILGLTPEQIDAVRKAEDDREKPRKGLLDRLDAVGS